MATGITSRKGATGISYRAEVWDNARGKRLTKTFPTHAAAKSWRYATASKVKAGQMGAYQPTTVEQAAWCLFVAAREGRALDRSGKPYKLSVIRLWESVLRRRVLPAFGSRKLTDLRTVQLQEFVDELVASGLSTSSAQNALGPLRVIYRFAIRYERCANNPTRDVQLGSDETPRDRIADPSKAELLLGALTNELDRAIWATAFYTGLRRGEIMALRVEDVDFKARVIRVERNYDPNNDVFTAPKTRAGVRVVPMPSVLLPHLMAVRRTEGLMFGRDTVTPFAQASLRRRALLLWAKADLEPITLHECRHTYASYMIAAGANAKTLSTYMGHTNIAITLDRYGHLFPGNEAEAAELLDAYLTRSLQAPRFGGDL